MIDGAAQTDPDGSTPAPAEDRPRVLLIVDDEPGVLRLAREVLRRAGFTVLGAHGATEAAELCRVHPGPIDAVLLDVILPEISGIELYPQLCEMRPELRVVFMGGYPSELVIGSKLTGAPFVQKPFQPRELVATIQSVLAAPAERRTL